MTGTANPLELLLADRQSARALNDPCAELCTLANVDGDGLPQARTVVLREIEDRLAVFVNATSPKYPFVERGPVSVVVWLPSITVQYRLACDTAQVPRALVAKSWQLRPEPPKRMDWFYATEQPQGSAIASRAALLERLEGLALPEPVEAPDSACGFYLEPGVVERLDLGQDDGIHDRRRYLPGNPGWHEQVLVP